MGSCLCNYNGQYHNLSADWILGSPPNFFIWVGYLSKHKQTNKTTTLENILYTHCVIDNLYFGSVPHDSAVDTCWASPKILWLSTQSIGRWYVLAKSGPKNINLKGVFNPWLHCHEKKTYNCSIYCNVIAMQVSLEQPLQLATFLTICDKLSMNKNISMQLSTTNNKCKIYQQKLEAKKLSVQTGASQLFPILETPPLEDKHILL